LTLHVTTGLVFAVQIAAAAGRTTSGSSATTSSDRMVDTNRLRPDAVKRISAERYCTPASRSRSWVRKSRIVDAATC